MAQLLNALPTNWWLRVQFFVIFRIIGNDVQANS